MKTLQKKEYQQTVYSICPVCGQQETNPYIQFCVECSGRMRLRDGTNACDKCGERHDQKVIYKERSFMLCPGCLVPLTKITIRRLS